MHRIQTSSSRVVLEVKLAKKVLASVKRPRTLGRRSSSTRREGMSMAPLLSTQPLVMHQASRGCTQLFPTRLTSSRAYSLATRLDRRSALEPRLPTLLQSTSLQSFNSSSWLYQTHQRTLKVWRLDIHLGITTRISSASISSSKLIFITKFRSLISIWLELRVNLLHNCW